MNNVELSELKALPKASNETSITIPAENSSTTNNNNGKFKNYFISHFGELSWQFQAQVKTIKKISKLPSVIKFLCSYYTCCCASWCQLLSGSWFLESLLDFFLELIYSPERTSHYFFCNILKFVLINQLRIWYFSMKRLDTNANLLGWSWILTNLRPRPQVLGVGGVETHKSLNSRGNRLQTNAELNFWQILNNSSDNSFPNPWFF